MNDKKIDKIIKSKIDIPEKVPNNINAIFDNFIAENVNSESTKGIKIKNKMSIGRRIITAISSIASSLVIGGVVYAAVTGKSVLDLFNINKDKYEQELINVNEHVLDNDIDVILDHYAVDHNSIIINYTIKSDVFLNFKENEENIEVKSIVDDEIELNVASQNYIKDEENNSYKVATLYSIEQYESTLDKFSLKVEIKSITGITGNWNFNINMDKSEKEENKTYVFNKTESGYAPRIALKTNYSPISMSVDNVSVSDFSSLMSITIFNDQLGVPDDKKVDTDKYNSVGIVYKNANLEKWDELVPLIFEVKDDKGNTLHEEKYNYQRKDISNIDERKLIFANVEREMKQLTLNVYSEYQKGKKVLLGNFELKLNKDTELTGEKFDLDSEKKIDKMNLTMKVPSKWNFDYSADAPYMIKLDYHDKYDSSISIGITEISAIPQNSSRYYVVYSDYSDIDKMIDESMKLNETQFDSIRTISKGTEKIGIFDGKQVTYVGYWDRAPKYKSKEMYAIINGKTYVISYTAQTISGTGCEAAYKEYYEVFESVIESIKLN